ncbi:MAG TPA: hypothetical protein PLH91_10030 [Tenuifilaceae bacterium]|nr:hypothetical protein [Tenuifilaceae bacterium]HPI45558.1 hypothetical protein [Tenuifilaceae bacterium]HPN20902.1 hypothetical protein [Tenuifilaceae bacterium]
MKKSRIIPLVLVAATISSCSNKKNTPNRMVYMRSDSTAKYSPARSSAIHGGGFYAFRPYGIYTPSGYQRTGYYSSGIHESSNYGTNPAKSSVTRGGFGRSGFHVSS